MSTQKKIKDTEEAIEKSLERGDEAGVEKYEDRLVELQRKLKKEEEDVKPHPSWVVQD